jgi:TolA-binding protein
LLPSLAIAVATALAPASLRATGDFYEEPLTSLPDFLKLDQLPAKTFQEILAETQRPAPEAEPIEMEKEVAAFEGKPGREVLAQIEKLLARARGAQDIEALKILNDLHDLYAGPANAQETAEYLAWRTTNAAFTPEDLDERLKKASPALRPHYLYLRGAALFLEHNDTDCQVWFEKILKESPKHPRAEIALYMLGRSQVSRSRTQNYVQGAPELDQKQRPRAKQLLEQYLAKYPKGRWAGDATGWLGAWYFDGGDFTAALRCYLQQLDWPEHPEYAGSAAIMCEKTLSHLASAPRDKAWAEVAKSPQAAQALVYLLINSTEYDNYNGSFDSSDEVRTWRKKLLPQIAAAIAGQDKLYQGATWRPRYLATLALAASGGGQQEQALKLLATVEAGTETDDLHLAKGVTLQRAKRSAEAIPVFRALLEKFPKSPLVRGARLRLGMTLADNHQAGQAILEFDHLLEKTEDGAANPTLEEAIDESGGYPIYSAVADDQVRQLIDLYLNFAPIEELASPALAPGFDPVQRLRFTEPIAQRLLTKEQFDEAKKYLTPAQFGLVAGPLEKLTIAAREAKEPAARAAACLALGDAWAAARGMLLTYPLDTDKTRSEVYPNEEAYADLRRSEAATVLGYTGNFRLDLENRDELRHAFNWWIEASDAQPGTAATATALWRALRSMALIADVSPYTYERARARKWDEVSRKLYERLRTECADSVEAKRYAVFWDFPGPKKRNPDEYAGRGDRDATGAVLPAAEALGLEMEDRDDSKERQTLATDVQQLVAEARTGKPAAIKAGMEKLSEEARAKFTGLYNARWVNFYEDLALFFSETEASPDVRARYVQLRARFLENTAIGGGYDEKPDTDTALQKDIEAALAEAQTKPVADYFEFLNLAVIANHFTFVKLNNRAKDKEAEVLEKSDDDTYRTRDYPLLARKAEAFLEKYPRSKKREAAMLLRARAVYRASAEVALRNFVKWPQGARWEGGYLSTVTAQEPFDSKRVLAALDAYDRAFPKGRYAADIRDYRAEVALRLHDWKPALEMTLAQFDDAKRPDLRLAAATRLGELFSQLADERYRADLLPAIKAQPRGRALLTQYLAFESTAHPLRYLGVWLREELAKR